MTREQRRMVEEYHDTVILVHAVRFDLSTDNAAEHAGWIRHHVHPGTAADSDVAFDGCFFEGRHFTIEPHGRVDDAHGDGGSRAFAKPHPKLDQWLGAERLQHHRMRAFGGPVSKEHSTETIGPNGARDE